MRGREEEVKMQRSISTEDDGIAAIILKTAKFGVNLRKCRLSKVAAASPRPRQILFEIIASLAVDFEGDGEKSGVGHPQGRQGGIVMVE